MAYKRRSLVARERLENLLLETPGYANVLNKHWSLCNQGLNGEYVRTVVLGGVNGRCWWETWRPLSAAVRTRLFHDTV